MAAAGLRASESEVLSGSDTRKLAIATLNRRQTTVPHQWLADHLAMRSAANVSQQLRIYAKSGKPGKLPPELKRYLAHAAKPAPR